MLYIFFVKQKTAYEMRISDWSSDVCSSESGIRGGWRRGFPDHDFAVDHRAVGQRLRQAVQFGEALGDQLFAPGPDPQMAIALGIGRASCRERVCQYV